MRFNFGTYSRLCTLVLLPICMLTYGNDVTLPNCIVYPVVDPVSEFDEASASRQCGPIDEKEIPVRTNGTISMTLVPLQDRENVRFNDQDQDTWCGAPGMKCVPCQKCAGRDCVSGECANRLVTRRMKVRLELLFKLASLSLPGQVVVVVKAFQEPTSSQPNISNSTSLHREGRAVLLQLQSKDPQQTLELSRLANCALFNTVQVRQQDHMVFVAVQKSDEDLTFETFPYMHMTGCSSSDKEYQEGTGLLYDSSIYTSRPLTKRLTVADFLQSPSGESEEDRCQVPTSRYFRLTSLLAECLDKLEEVFSESGEYIEKNEPVLTVEHGYMTSSVHQNMVNWEFLATTEGKYWQSTNELDNSKGRRNHQSGNAVLFSSPLPPLQAVNILVKTLGPLVRERGLYLGIALHNVTRHPCPFYNREGIYFDIRERQHAAWVTYDNFFDKELRITSEYFSQKVMELFKRLPLFLRPYKGAGSIVPPKPHGPGYEYIPPGRFAGQKNDPCILTEKQRENFIIKPLQDKYKYGTDVKFRCKNGRKLWQPLVDGFASSICVYGDIDGMIAQLCKGDLLDDLDDTNKPNNVEKETIAGKSVKDVENEKWCNATEQYRKAATKSLWQIIKRRPGHRDSRDVQEALEQCLWRLCGNRRKGTIWNQKMEHCSNFLHWVPSASFGGLVNGTLHLSEDTNSIRLACGKHKSCVQKTDIHALISSTIERRYKSPISDDIEFQLYSEHKNPLPLFSIIDELFVMSLKGRVTVFIQKYTELGALEDALRALMTYNRNVEEVKFAVLNATRPYNNRYDKQHNRAVNLVYNTIQRMVSGWTKLVNSKFARDSVVSFLVEAVNYQPEADTQDAEPYIRSIKQLREWEFKWLEKLRNI